MADFDWQRLVVKDAKFTTEIAQNDGAWVIDDKTGVFHPIEFIAPEMLANKEGSEFVLRKRGWREMYEFNSFRMLMEFYPHGDLYQTMEQARGARLTRWPQPFLWYVFEALATAGVLMVSSADTRR